ncbi:hypothetical protein HG536_0C02200 [Torulaspora globosa]|uniref:Phospholipid/glycerol acyltransferase domain-containing protein n=1 Tax=Torulaspora globosa TaxID=48254 RepID=A0A7G3ZEW5_9SACH|nr:uncharacterized protein HG536_0C02200 [Torulaspora globosa]QLL32051.1 hypothetical protein HG536_0C02200 [Torulaspora globosa]
MEKFTNWRDKGTGIAPFLPPSVGSIGVASMVGYIVLSVLKTILISPLVAVYVLTGSKPLFGLIAYILFDWKVDVTVQGVKRRLLNKREHYPHENAVYLCNSSSAVDAHVLDSIANGEPSFLIARDNQLFKMSKSQYMQFALDGSLNVKKYGKEIHSIEKSSGQVTFIFPEGTCSNGKTVLPFEIDEEHLAEFLEPLGSNVAVQVIHLKTNASLTTPLRVSKWEFVSRAIVNGVHVKVKMHEPQGLRPLEKLRVVMNDGNKFKLVSKTLNVEAKRKFVEEYEKR